MDNLNVCPTTAHAMLDLLSPKLEEVGPDEVSPYLLGMHIMLTLTGCYIQLEPEVADQVLLDAQTDFLAGVHAVIGPTSGDYIRLDS